MARLKEWRVLYLVVRDLTVSIDFTICKYLILYSGILLHRITCIQRWYLWCPWGITWIVKRWVVGCRQDKNGSELVTASGTYHQTHSHQEFHVSTQEMLGKTHLMTQGSVLCQCLSPKSAMVRTTRTCSTYQDLHCLSKLPVVSSTPW